MRLALGILPLVFAGCLEGPIAPEPESSTGIAFTPTQQPSTLTIGVCTLHWNPDLLCDEMDIHACVTNCHLACYLALDVPGAGTWAWQYRAGGAWRTIGATGSAPVTAPGVGAYGAVIRHAWPGDFIGIEIVIHQPGRYELRGLFVPGSGYDPDQGNALVSNTWEIRATDPWGDQP